MKTVLMSDKFPFSYLAPYLSGAVKDPTGFFRPWFRHAATIELRHWQIVPYTTNVANPDNVPVPPPADGWRLNYFAIFWELEVTGPQYPGAPLLEEVDVSQHPTATDIMAGRFPKEQGGIL